MEILIKVIDDDGVPLITPVVGLRERPVGRIPDWIVNDVVVLKRRGIVLNSSPFFNYGTWVKNRFQNFSLFLKKHYISIVLLSFLLLSFSSSSSLFPLSFDMLISIISLVFREINDEVW